MRASIASGCTHRTEKHIYKIRHSSISHCITWFLCKIIDATKLWSFLIKDYYPAGHLIKLANYFWVSFKSMILYSYDILFENIFAKISLQKSCQKIIAKNICKSVISLKTSLKISLLQRLRRRRDEVKQQFVKNRRSGEFGYRLDNIKNRELGEETGDSFEMSEVGVRMTRSCKDDTLDPATAEDHIKHNLRPLIRNTM